MKIFFRKKIHLKTSWIHLGPKRHIWDTFQAFQVYPATSGNCQVYPGVSKKKFSGQRPENFIFTLIKKGFLTSGHARALLNCNDAVSLSNLIVKKGLSVRQTELLAKRDKIEISNKKAVPIKKDLDTKLLEDELTAHLKFKVNIHADKKKNKGKINIQYNDNEELQTICEILKKQF